MSNISLESIFSILNQAVTACWDWFYSLFNGHWYLLLLGVIFFFVFARLILVPFFGGHLTSVGSDSVKKEKISKNDFDMMYAASMSDGLGDGD